jgi:ribosomal protein L40E
MFEKPLLESIARLLSLMAAPPNLRSQPLPGDRPGAFTQWFDGGAINTAAGYTAFEFNDGSRGLIPAPFPHIFIQLASGEHLSLSLENVRMAEASVPSASAVPAVVAVPSTPTLEPPASMLICPRCGHDNTAVARFCSECGTTLGSIALPPDAAPAPKLAQPSIPVAPAVSQSAEQRVAVPTVAQPVAAMPPVFAQIETIPPADKKCLTCGLDNKPGARFCRRCGLPLA